MVLQIEVVVISTNGRTHTLDTIYPEDKVVTKKELEEYRLQLQDRYKQDYDKDEINVYFTYINKNKKDANKVI
jgi:hypothetical protein